jgi:hypothetical protein
MEHMTRSYPKENAMLRPHKESTLEKEQRMRRDKKKPPELAVGGKGEMLNPKENARMKRKQALADAMNKIHDPDIA